MHRGTCVTHVPWCMLGSLTRGDGENVPDIPGACATRKFTYLVRGPWDSFVRERCQLISSIHFSVRTVLKYMVQLMSGPDDSKVVTAFDINPDVGDSSPTQVETHPVSETSRFSQEHPPMNECCCSWVNISNANFTAKKYEYGKWI